MSSRNLSSLPANSLRLLVEYLAELKDDAERREAAAARQDAALTERRKSRGELADMVQSHLANGHSLDAACRHVENQTGWRIDTILANYRHQVRQSVAAGKTQRDALALRLAHKGWTNGEIAAHLGISPATVSRIIGKVYRVRTDKR